LHLLTTGLNAVRFLYCLSMEQRFIRTQALLGQNTVKTYAASTVLVTGLGGVGSWACEILVRAGIGRLILIDKDTIEYSNFNRQLFATEEMIGADKYQAARRRLHAINPHAVIEGGRFFISRENAGTLINQYQPDYIIDAIDSIGPKSELIAAAVKNSVKIVSCLGAARKTDPSQFSVIPLFATHSCPLARALRKALRKLAVTAEIPAVFSPEPARTEDLSALSIPEGQKFLGSFAPVVAAAGLLAADKVLADLRRT
jgi:tRNA A37 threonylcarbamoyladenosine dehydratase